MQSSENRIVYLDLLRLIATFAVVLLHVSCGGFLSFTGDTNYYVSLVYDGLTRWCVPVFVMISGALFLRPEKTVTLKGLYGKSIGRLVICYVLWSLIYYLLFSFDGNFSMRFLLHPHFHLWFLRMLVFVYVLVPILRIIAHDEIITKYCLIVWTLYLILSFAGRFELFRMNPVVGYSGYFLLGYYLSQKTFTKRQLILVCLLGVAGIVVTLLGTGLLSEKNLLADEQFFSYLTANVAAMAVAVFVTVKKLADKCGNGVARFLGVIGKDLFGVYLTHALWLPLLNTPTIRSWGSPVIMIPLIALAVFALSLALTRLMRLIPVLKKIVE